MTTICAALHEGHAFYGCDGSTSIGGERVYTVDAFKKYIVKENNFFGIVGSPTFLLALRTFLNEENSISLKNENDVYHFLLRLQTNLKEHQFLNSVAGEDSAFEPIGFSMLIANSHGIFSTYDTREVIPHSNYYAIGSGKEYALGAMSFAAKGTSNPRKIIEAGLYSACKFDLHTDENWEIRKI